jgi:hypothetical protein
MSSWAEQVFEEFMMQAQDPEYVMLPECYPHY